MRTRTLLIFPLARQATANAAAVLAAGPHAVNTFSVLVEKGGSPVTTHCAACWDMTNVQLARFRQEMPVQAVVHENAGRVKMNEEGYTHIRGES